MLFVAIGCGSLGDASSRSNTSARFGSLDTEAAALVRQVRTQDGFTVNPRDGVAPECGYVVNTGVGARVERAADFFGGQNYSEGQRLLEQFVQDSAEALAANPNLYIGAWYNRRNQEVVLSTVELVADRDNAIRLGLAHQQSSVYDLASGRDVPTGGPGMR